MPSQKNNQECIEFPQNLLPLQPNAQHNYHLRTNVYLWHPIGITGPQHMLQMGQSAFSATHFHVGCYLIIYGAPHFLQSYHFSHPYNRHTLLLLQPRCFPVILNLYRGTGTQKPKPQAATMLSPTSSFMWNQCWNTLRPDG